MTSDLAGAVRRQPWAALAIVLAILAIGYSIGTWRSGVSFHSGMADPGENAIYIEADGWSYNIPSDVMWEDQMGVQHDGGRPECLPPSNHQAGPIRLVAVEVTVEGGTWRQIVWVSCRYVTPPPQD